MPLQLQQSKPQDSSLGVRKIGPNSAQSFTFSLFRHPTEKTLAENSVKKEYSPRKKFAAAKRAMGDAHCDDQESSHELQKRLKLSNQKYYDAIRAMREGREVGHNGRPSYLLHPEKVQFWSWVDKGVGSGDPPLYPDMQRYVSQIVRSKRPSLLKKRRLVSHDYIAHLLKEGGFETVPCKNAYEANELLPIDEVRGFFKKVRDVIDHYHIKHQNVWNFDESWVSPEDKAPRCYVPHKKGTLAARHQGHPRAHFTLMGCINAVGDRMDEVYLIPEKNNAVRIAEQIGIPRNCVKKTEKGWVDNNALYWWIVNHAIPEVDKRRGGNCEEHALILADPHGSRYDPRIAKQLAKKNIHLLLFPAGTTALLQPLDVGVYAPYKQFLRKWMENSQIVPVLEASRDAFSSAFTRVNIKEAWEATTLLSEDHSSIDDQLPVSNPFRHQSRHRNSGDDLLC